MVLFGKDINMQMDERSSKMLAGALVLIVAVVIGMLLLYPAFQEYSAKLEEEKSAMDKYNTAQSEYQKEKKAVDELLANYENQKKHLEELKIKFQNSSLTDETDLKIAVQRLITALNIQMKETGASEVAEDRTDNGYMKKYIPYTITGDFASIGRFLYYLENSKWLLTFWGSDLTIKKVKEKNRDVIEAKFKVGAYYILKGGELDFD